MNIKWFEPMMTGTEIARISAVLERGYPNDGDETRLFETEFALALGVRHAVAVSNGTAAITCSLIAAGIQPGDEVIVPNFTFIATANAARLMGAKVVLVDIEPDRLLICPDRVANAITPKTKAIVSVDVNGRAADYNALESICEKHGLILICDSAEAIGSRVGSKSIGTFGLAGTFSFSPAKTITTGQGGMVVTDNDDFAMRLRAAKDQGRPSTGTGGDDIHPLPGANFKFTNLQAAVGIEQLTVLNKRLQRAAKRDVQYRAHLNHLDSVRVPDIKEGEVLQWTDIMTDRRDEICRALDENNIGFRRFWRPIHSQPNYEGSDADFPNSIKASEHGIWLPSAFDLSDDNIDVVCNLIKATLNQH